MGELEMRRMEEEDIIRHIETAEKESRLRIQELRKKADSFDRTANHIATERWNLAEDLIGEDDEGVRRQILTELAVLQRIKDVMECESKRKEDE